MNIIEKIRQKPQAEKLKIIWTVAIITAILLIIVWIISARYYKRADKDTTFFQTIGQGIKDVRENFRK
jgi:predicted permease